MGVEGLRVIIVGAGFAGLTAAIECRLRGMHSILVESYPTSRNYGDIIDFLPNGGMHIDRWDNGRISHKLLEVCLNDTDELEYIRYDGKKILGEPFLLKKKHYYQMLAGHRGEMHQIVTDYATEIGVEMRFGQHVVEYLESETELGVLTKSGIKILGDVVVASDGPKSLGRTQILNLPESKVNSGYAIYRAFYTITDEHRANPWLKTLTRESPNCAQMWIGKDLHAFIYTWKKGTSIGWVITHKDENDIGESWSFPGDKDEALAFLEEAKFSEVVKEVVRYTPPKNLVDYKLVWRDPLTTWIGKSKRSLVIGDAAHCHLPTSAQGGCQAIEDGVALAVCLEKADGDVPLALQVFERIRFNRSHVIHMSSITNRDGYHNADFDGEYLLNHPEIINVPRPTWVVDHDARQNAEDHFAHLAEDVKSGRKGTIEELSLPADGNYEDVTTRVYGTQEIVNKVADERPAVVVA